MAKKAAVKQVKVAKPAPVKKLTKKQQKEQEALIAYKSKGKQKAIGEIKKKGISKTMAKLMQKYNCATVEDYRKVRKANRARIEAENKARVANDPNRKTVFVKPTPVVTNKQKK